MKNKNKAATSEEVIVLGATINKSMMPAIFHCPNDMVICFHKFQGQRRK